MPDQPAMNELLRRLDPADREVLARMLEQAFVSGVHETLLVAHEEGIEPFRSGGD